MPEFSPGESKVAKVTMFNPTGKAFGYSAELYMGTNLALMVSTPFHLEAGESKDIELPIIMPSDAGTYPVYIGVFSNGQFIEPLYKVIEDVIIAAPILAALGITLKNPPPSATTWRWTLCYRRADGTPLIKDSHVTPIDEVAYAIVPPVPLPNPLCEVIVWHMVDEEWVLDGHWAGEILISEYGSYEFNWNTKTLTRVG